MKIENLITETAKRIRSVGQLAGIPVIEEDKGDINAKLKADISKKRVAVMVKWDGFDPDTSSSKTVVGKTTVVVSVFEQPLINRKNDASLTLLAIAQIIGKEINLLAMPDFSTTLVLKRITPVQLLDESTISCDVEFTAKATL